MRESCRVAWAENGFGFTFDEGYFAIEDVHQFIFRFMPVLDGRPCARHEGMDKRTELGQFARFTDPLFAIQHAGR